MLLYGVLALTVAVAAADVVVVDFVAGVVAVVDADVVDCGKRSSVCSNGMLV